MSAIFREQGIAARETGKLRELFDATLCPMEHDLGRDKSRLTVLSFDSVRFSDVNVINDRGIGQRTGIRKPCHVRANYSDDFLLCLPHRAEVWLEQCGVRSHFGAGSFALLSTARPFSAAIAAEQPHVPFAHTIVRVPGPRLRSRLARIDDYCGLPLTIRPGVGRIMVSLFDLALTEGAFLAEDDARRFGETLLESIASAARGAPEFAAPARSLPSAKQRLRERASHFMLSRLSDPNLDAEVVARHCDVSIRYLRDAFADASGTVGAFIREARLRECRAALRDPRLDSRSVIEIAMMWGFNDAAYFSRTYRRQFGITPSDERRLSGGSARNAPSLAVLSCPPTRLSRDGG